MSPFTKLSFEMKIFMAFSVSLLLSILILSLAFAFATSEQQGKPKYVDKSSETPKDKLAEMEAMIDQYNKKLENEGYSGGSSSTSTSGGSDKSSSSKSKGKSGSAKTSDPSKKKKKKDTPSEASDGSYVNRPPNPSDLGLLRANVDRSSITLPPLTKRVKIPGGVTWLGTQMDLGAAGKVLPAVLTDGSHPRVKVMIRGFNLDVDCVSNRQFEAFIKHTGYKTDSELYGWSFVLDSQVSAEVKAEVDGPTGYGRVKDSHHWMGVKQASWFRPHGGSSSPDPDLPAVHISYNDAFQYCAWAGLRLPTGHEWEYAARGGKVNTTYPWGKSYDVNRLNIWQGKFPDENSLLDGYHGPAPIGDRGLPPQNDYGLYNMLGNVWEWVAEDFARRKRKDKKQPFILRGGSFLDSKDGSFNHLVSVATQQTSTADSAASNIGFRCAEDSLADVSPLGGPVKIQDPNGRFGGGDDLEL